MDKETIIQKTADMIRTQFEADSSGHDWWHIYRVWQLAKTIAKQEETSDIFVVELGALLHDVADFKFHNGDELIGGKVGRKWLEDLNVENEIIDAVVHIIDNVSFKGGLDQNKMQSLEGKIVQDADRLDAIGAIGIARCFAYGGSKGDVIYNPDIAAKPDMTKEEYKNHKGSSINHFYEKLLLLKDLMNTDTGKEIAKERDDFIQKYLKEFLEEWEGKK